MTTSSPAAFTRFHVRTELGLPRAFGEHIESAILAASHVHVGEDARVLAQEQRMAELGLAQK